MKSHRTTACCASWAAICFSCAAQSAAQSTPKPGESRWLRNIRQLTREEMGFTRAGEAYFSPDGERICFQAYPAGQDEYQIYVMDIDPTGRKGVDLPVVKSMYWPHRANFERLSRSGLDWRLLCPGPMVDQPPLGLNRLRVAADRWPVQAPGFARALPGLLFLPFFLYLLPEMIVPYADAAAFMLAHLDPANPRSRRRVGLALPPGMRGRKSTWAASS